MVLLLTDALALTVNQYTTTCTQKPSHHGMVEMDLGSLTGPKAHAIST